MIHVREQIPNEVSDKFEEAIKEMRENMFSGGSGSDYIQGFNDAIDRCIMVLCKYKKEE